MPKDYHEDLGHGGAPKADSEEEEKALQPEDQLDETERARSRAGAGFRGKGDEYKQAGAGQAGYRATKNPKAARKRH